MNNINKNLDFLKKIIETRETYINFSALGTAIMGIMYIIYYFFWNSICDSGLCFVNLFLIISIFGFFLVTILSILKSKIKKQKIFPKSIIYIIGNIIFISIIFFIIILKFVDFTNIISISFLFYSLLIIVSRNIVPFFIKYFGYIVFVSGLFLVYHPSFFLDVIFIVLGLGHIVIAFLLKINDDKNE